MDMSQPDREQHECSEHIKHQNIAYCLDTEIYMGGMLVVFDNFNAATPEKLRKKNPDSFHININNCPWCGKELSSL